jgi:hypothetical protein
VTRCARCDWQPDPVEAVFGSARDQLGHHAETAGHPLCLVCHRSLPAQDRQTCEKCLTRAREQLAGISLMYDELPKHLRIVTGSNWGQGSRGGSDGRPLPGGDVLALLGPGHEGLREDGLTSRDSDPVSVAYELSWWAEEWQDTRGERATDARPRNVRAVVRQSVGYLERHARWAAEHHPGFARYATDLRQLHSRLEHATGRAGRREIAEAECFDCGGNLIHALDEKVGYDLDAWTCQRCGSTYDWNRYLLALRAHLQAHPAQGWSLPEHVALTLGASAKTVRSWASRGVVAAACLVGDRRLRVWFPEVAAEHERRLEAERRRAERNAQKAG